MENLLCLLLIGFARSNFILNGDFEEPYVDPNCEYTTINIPHWYGYFDL